MQVFHKKQSIDFINMRILISDLKNTKHFAFRIC